jgi:hypothetical protein
MDLIVGLNPTGEHYKQNKCSRYKPVQLNPFSYKGRSNPERYSGCEQKHPVQFTRQFLSLGSKRVFLRIIKDTQRHYLIRLHPQLKILSTPG